MSDVNSVSTEMSDMRRYLELFPPALTNHCKVIGDGETVSYAFHISVNNKIKTFAPAISRRTLTKEDRSMARISTAMTLNGCISGYCALIMDWDYQDAPNWQGGWKIYAIPYKLAIEPGKKILDDVDRTGEVWLVGYNKSSRTYPALPIGEMVVVSVSTVVDDSLKNRKRRTVVSMYVRVEDGFQLPLNKQVVLRAGYYNITYNDFFAAMDLRSPQDILVRPVSSQEFSSRKRIEAGNLEL